VRAALAYLLLAAWIALTVRITAASHTAGAVFAVGSLVALLIQGRFRRPQGR
jgi:hypothetical protein